MLARMVPISKLMLMLMNFDEFLDECIDYFPGSGPAAGDDRLWCIRLTFSLFLFPWKLFWVHICSSNSFVPM